MLVLAAAAGADPSLHSPQESSRSRPRELLPLRPDLSQAANIQLFADTAFDSVEDHPYLAVDGAPSHLVHFKLHKVGGSSMSEALSAAKWVNQSALPNPAIHCLGHATSLGLMDLFRSLPVLEAPKEQRIHALRQLDDPRGALVRCPLPDDGRPLLTVVVLRDPVERLVSKYYYEQGIPMCIHVRNSSQPCAADVLPLTEWARLNSMHARWDSAAASWTAVDQHGGIACEPLEVLGGKGCSEAGLQTARRIMKAIDVVAITELMDVSARLIERKLGLVEKSLVIAHGNSNEDKPNVTRKTRETLAQLPSVQLERKLYEEAQSRFRFELRAAGLPAM